VLSRLAQAQLFDHYYLFGSWLRGRKAPIIKAAKNLGKAMFKRW
jgi:hypothetical protein